MRCPKYPRIRLLVKLLGKCSDCERFSGSEFVEDAVILFCSGAGFYPGSNKHIILLRSF